MELVQTVRLPGGLEGEGERARGIRHVVSAVGEGDGAAGQDQQASELPLHQLGFRPGAPITTRTLVHRGLPPPQTA